MIGNAGEKNTAFIKTRIDAALYEQVKSFCERDGRNIRSLVEIALRKYIIENKPALEPNQLAGLDTNLN